MRILKPGRDQHGWTTEATCTGDGNGGGGCGALLLMEEGDLYRTASNHYDGSREEFATFTCEACGVLTDLKGVPGPVWRRVRQWAG